MGPITWWAGLVASVVPVHAATVDFSVVVGREVPADAVTLEVQGTWLDEPFTVVLRDEHDVRGDGVWSGEWTGDAVRLLPVRLMLRQGDGPAVELAASTELLDERGGALTWALDADPRSTRPRARRVAWIQPARQMERLEAATTAAGLGWFAVVFFYIAWWAADRRPATGRSRRRGKG